MPWLILAATAVWLTLWPEPAAFADRAAIVGGDGWRLWTGPLQHADPAHLTRDLMGLLGLAWLLRGRLGRAQVAALLAIGLPLPVLGALAGDPSLGGYLGLSGLVHGLAALAVFEVASERPALGALLGASLLGKVLFEVHTGALLVPLPGLRPAVWGHAAGLLTGLMVALPRWLAPRIGRATPASTAAPPG